jgi:hypothetical protein
MWKRLELFISSYLERKYIPLLETGGQYIVLHNPTNPDEPGCIRFFPFGYDNADTFWPKWKMMHVVINLWLRPDTGKRHSHKGWSITLVLTGTGTEDTEKNKRRLCCGSLVFRDHQTPHRFVVDEDTAMWTLFIYGPRKHEQVWV